MTDIYNAIDSLDKVFQAFSKQLFAIENKHSTTTKITISPNGREPSESTSSLSLP